MKKRVGDIEYKKVYPSNLKSQKQYIDIVKWEPNPYYGRESDYERTCFGSYKTEYGFIDESCFKNKETCYSLGIIEIKEEPVIRFIGLRPLDLKGKDAEDFEKAARLAYRYAEKIYEKSKNYKR